eukprot:6178652-Pleurochrysis_carterae.AAC.1
MSNEYQASELIGSELLRLLSTGEVVNALESQRRKSCSDAELVSSRVSDRPVRASRLAPFARYSLPADEVHRWLCEHIAVDNSSTSASSSLDQRHVMAQSQYVECSPSQFELGHTNGSYHWQQARQGLASSAELYEPVHQQLPQIESIKPRSESSSATLSPTHSGDEDTNRRLAEKLLIDLEGRFPLWAQQAADMRARCEIRAVLCGHVL